MKNIFVIALMFTVVSLFGQARFGIKVDPQLSWYTSIGEISEGAGNKAGVNIGLVIDNYFAENYAFNTGISLNINGGGLVYDTQQTFKLNGEDVIVPANQTIQVKTQYITVPLGFKFLSKSIGYVKIYTDLGGDLLVRVRALVDIPEDVNNDAKDEIGIFNLAYHIGGGIEYSLGGNTSLVTGISYSNGFIDATKDTDTRNDNVNLNTVALRLGIMF